MPVVVTQPDRESFLRCERQWDFRAQMRRNLQSVRADTAPDLSRALHGALAIYYFPGMWDWDRRVTTPLVLQGFERELSRQRARAAADAGHDWAAAHEAGREILGRYFDWAPATDRFSPVLIEADFDVQVLHPVQPGAGLTGRDGQPVRYRGRIDMLAVDEHDAYWILRHSFLAGPWPAADGLRTDDASLTAAWAWEQFYLGMAIAGTIHNEVRLPSGDDAAPNVHSATPVTPPPRETGPGPQRRGLAGWRRGRPDTAAPATGDTGPLVRQHEPSGGGRSIPQHRRLYARARERAGAAEVEQHAAGPFRRTLVRHSPQAIAESGRRLAADAAAMVAAGLDAAPNPGDANCRPCAFLQPCLAMRAGRDSECLLRSGYRVRPPDALEEGRLGGGAWGMGRGAAPFRRG